MIARPHQWTRPQPNDAMRRFWHGPIKPADWQPRSAMEDAMMGELMNLLACAGIGLGLGGLANSESRNWRTFWAIIAGAAIVLRTGPF